MDSDGKSKKKLVFFILALLVATFLLIFGIVLICLHTKTDGSYAKIDYTDCTDDNNPNQKCKDNRLKTFCKCYKEFNITKPITGAVNVYYELPEFDQTRLDYARSRDDAQLAGNLSSVVSKDCGNYSYVDSKPIAPCGEIADSMFIDAYDLVYNNTLAPLLETGLSGITDEDKKRYHNPPGDLNEAFKNYSNPRSWAASKTNITILDLDHPDNNGFQNERFIAWMKTDMKLKPAYRLNHSGIFEDGLPAGRYFLQVFYYPSKYVTGPRIAVLSSLHTITNTGQLIAGIILLLIGICLVGLIAYYRIVHKSYIPCKTESDK